MAEVYTVTLIIIGILLSVPALLVALNLLLPTTTTHAYNRLKQTPGRSLALGLPVTLFFVGWVLVTAQANFALLRALAFISAVVGMGVGAIGGAGLARLLGERLGGMSRPNSSLANLVRGAVVYELACLVPFVGWFLFIPLAGTAAMGAAIFGLLRWAPRPGAAPQPAPLAQTDPNLPRPLIIQQPESS